MKSKKKKVLFAWVGFRDLNEMKEKGLQEHLRDVADRFIDTELKTSPISTIINGNTFARIELFWNFDRKNVSKDDETLLKREYEEYIKKMCDSYQGAVTLSEIKATSHDFNKIYTSVLEYLKKDEFAEIEPYFILSSGTRVMAAVWIVLGKTLFREKARYFQVKEGDESSPEPETIDWDVEHQIVQNAFEHIDQTDPSSPERTPFCNIQGKSELIRRTIRMAKKAAMTDFNILLTGESGTGKEEFARAIHQSSSRRNAQFFPVNCAAIPPNLLESELFGYEKGAFTGASETRQGLFERANGGTVFLDELEACPQDLQAKLLRVLQPPAGTRDTCRCFTRVGGRGELKSDVRIIGATNEQLNSEENHFFRSDLFNRIATLSISLPSLRERREDIQEIALAQLDACKRKLEKQGFHEYKNKNISAETIKFMQNLPWPGNVRQMQNVIVQALVFGDSSHLEITMDDIRQILDDKGFSETSTAAELPEVSDLPENFDLDRKLNEIRASYIRAACRKYPYSKKSEVANSLGLSHYQTLDNVIRKLKRNGFLEKDFSLGMNHAQLDSTIN